MADYKLYIIDEEVALRYYGQEAKLYYLFVEHEKATGTQKDLIYKQINYITNPIPVLRLHQSLKKAFRHTKGYEYYKDTHIVTDKKIQSQGRLMMGRDVIYLSTTGETNEIETMFFEILRKSEPMFFAVSLDQKRYGWLKPLKNNFFLTQKEV